MSAYTRQKAKYRNRIRLERASQELSNDTTKTPYDRLKHCRERKRVNAAELINDGHSTSAAVEIMQEMMIAFILTPDCSGNKCVGSSFMKTHWAAWLTLNCALRVKTHCTQTKCPRSNRFVYPPKQHGLHALDPMNECRDGHSCTSIGCDAINVPMDVETLVPRPLDDDQLFIVT
ncbi:uncharacterized protein TNCT_144271 [Trichonephila clavata]|uniref:Uncharacterized protein n=1 Tax=Trichonephila clavata TaxID=2740835 RepID=A0A8X6KNG5_TRICU|nr:uncharacterized protein TNCT_144271 [Trichonephila clavata]